MSSHPPHSDFKNSALKQKSLIPAVLHPEDRFWNPYFAGLMLGLVLLASFLIMGKGLGASGAANRLGIATLSTVAPDYVASNSFMAKPVPAATAYWTTISSSRCWAFFWVESSRRTPPDGSDRRSRRDREFPSRSDCCSPWRAE